MLATGQMASVCPQLATRQGAQLNEGPPVSEAGGRTLRQDPVPARAPTPGEQVAGRPELPRTLASGVPGRARPPGHSRSRSGHSGAGEGLRLQLPTVSRRWHFRNVWGGVRRPGPQSARPGRWLMALCLARAEDTAGPLLSAVTTMTPRLT